MATLATTPNPVVERIGALIVVRDDLLPGGTKDRVAGVVVAGASGVVYASPGEGYAQMAIARACSARGIPAVIFTAARKKPHRNTIRAATFGADIMPVRPGYLCVVQARAREHAVAHGLRMDDSARERRAESEREGAGPGSDPYLSGALVWNVGA